MAKPSNLTQFENYQANSKLIKIEQCVLLCLLVAIKNTEFDVWQIY
jgi:hypothetical protein